MSDYTHKDVLVRLKAWSSLKTGDILPFPDAPAPNNWGEQLSAVMKDAIEEIERLRAEGNEVVS